LLGVANEVAVGELLFFALGLDGFVLEGVLSPLEEPPFFRRLSSTTVNPSGSTMGVPQPAIEGTDFIEGVMFGGALTVDEAGLPYDELEDVCENGDRASL